MRGEIAIGGVYLPGLLVLAVLALLLLWPLRLGLDRLGLYRWTGSRPLTDLALFVLTLGLIVLVTLPGAVPGLTEFLP
ncbi:DUF1656 domain-containing protein [Sphingomonas sp. ac-8]|uniref:DUF1656 domain-containing protein n=1 Tax=Sphingomonas sp. ac-8 TaxID=3242977 RepID=UPI003A7FBAE9